MLFPSRAERTVSALLAARSRRDTLLFIMFFVALLGLTPFFIMEGVSVGFSVVLGVLVALTLALCLVRWPIFGLYLVVASTLLIEQEPLPTPIITDTLYVFSWPTKLQGFVERPIGLIILLALFFWLFQRLTQREQALKGGALIIPFTLYMLCVVGGVVYGLATGGNLKIIVVQVRPFWYMFISYILAYNFVTRKSHVRNFFWLAIISAGVKALQGLYIYLIVLHGDLAGRDFILSHEESFFFAALLLLVIIFCLHYRHRAQLIVALCIMPAVIVSMVANHRRTDYIALLAGVGVAWVLIFQIKPKARLPLIIGLLIFSLLGAGYVLAFQHGSGSFAEPARAIVAVFHPSDTDTRDMMSNLYRIFEDNDLKYTVRLHPLGLGFGKAYLQPEPLTSIFPNILDFDPYYNFVPHNTIYWIWVDLGPIGYFALWLLLGAIIVRGCLTVRTLRDPYLQVVTIYIVAIVFMEVIVSFADYQLFFYRNVIYLGLLCGILAKIPTLDQQEQKEAFTHEHTNDISTPTRSLVGSSHP